MSTAKTHVFKVGMTCQGCATAVEKVLNKSKDKGIEEISTDLAGQKVKVKTTLSPQEILEIIKKTGKQTEFLQTL